MADITKCPGNNCQRRDTCYRYTAAPSQHWQAWQPAPEDPEKCESYYKDWRLKDEA